LWQQKLPLITTKSS